MNVTEINKDIDHSNFTIGDRYVFLFDKQESNNSIEATVMGFGDSSVIPKGCR